MAEAVVPNPASELDSFVAGFEAAQARSEHADLGAFLPSLDHPLYQQVLRELIRVDLEYGWTRGRPQSLEHYLARFPQLTRDADALREVAFEEYRLRRQAGQCPTPEDYVRHFGVDAADWVLRVPAHGTRLS